MNWSEFIETNLQPSEAEKQHSTNIRKTKYTYTYTYYVSEWSGLGNITENFLRDILAMTDRVLIFAAYSIQVYGIPGAKSNKKPAQRARKTVSIRSQHCSLEQPVPRYLTWNFPRHNIAIFSTVIWTSGNDWWRITRVSNRFRYRRFPRERPHPYSTRILGVFPLD